MSSERKTGKNRAENKKKLAPKLSLRANPKDFDSSAVFVQGELFPDFDPDTGGQSQVPLRELPTGNLIIGQGKVLFSRR